MHVAYVLKQYPKLSETFILNEMLELERQGVQVTVLALEPSSEGRFHEGVTRLNADVVYAGGWKGQRAFDHLSGRIAELREVAPRVQGALEEVLVEGRSDVFKLLPSAMALALEARARGVEHLHAHFANAPAELARLGHRLSGIPWSFTCHAKDIYHDSVDRRRLRRLANEAEFVVTVCDANLDHLRSTLDEGDPATLIRLYNGIDLERFHPRRRRETTPPLILGVGRLVEKKGFADLIRAAAILERQGRRFQCQIVGEGRAGPALDALIARLGVTQVELIGARTQAEVGVLLAGASLVALPCIVADDGNRDALPTVLLEALGSGVPVVSTPVVGIGEILDGGRCGELVPPSDPKALAAALGALLDDGDRRSALSTKGRERAESLFDLQTNVETLRLQFGEQSAWEARVS